MLHSLLHFAGIVLIIIVALEALWGLYLVWMVIRATIEWWIIDRPAEKREREARQA